MTTIALGEWLGGREGKRRVVGQRRWIPVPAFAGRDPPPE